MGTERSAETLRTIKRVIEAEGRAYGDLRLMVGGAH
jgi:hypothetical protein